MEMNGVWIFWHMQSCSCKYQVCIPLRK